MITDSKQLEGALRQIAWAADALEGIRRDVNSENARVFPVIAESYLSQIRMLTADVRQYLQADVTLREEAEPQRVAAEPIAA